MPKKEEENSYPIFPLSINVLPGAYLPLQIFEPRYLDMVKSSLAKEEGFCIALTKDADGISVGGLPSHHDICTYVEIVDFNQLQNGLLGITVKGLDKVMILDRWKQDDELLIAPFPFPVIHLPLSQASIWMPELPNQPLTVQPVVVICHLGVRSWKFANWLLEQEWPVEVWNLEGGIAAWSDQVDDSIARY